MSYTFTWMAVVSCSQDPQHLQLVNWLTDRLQRVGGTWCCQIGDASMLRLLQQQLRSSAGKARVVLVLCPDVRHIFRDDSHDSSTSAWRQCLLQEVGGASLMYVAVTFADLLSEADAHYFSAIFSMENVYTILGPHCQLSDLLRDLTEAVAPPPPLLTPPHSVASGSGVHGHGQSWSLHPSLYHGESCGGAYVRDDQCRPPNTELEYEDKEDSCTCMTVDEGEA
jgi:hypothetical protein